MFRLNRVRSLLNRPASRAAVWLLVAALLMGSATRFGFHAHADDGDGHGHHHDYPALVDHHGQSGGDADDGEGAAVLHGHDFATVATLTVSDHVPGLTPAPLARVQATPASPPDCRPTAPPIRPPIA